MLNMKILEKGRFFLLAENFFNNLPIKGTSTPTKESLYTAGYSISNNVTFNFFFPERCL